MNRISRRTFVGTLAASATGSCLHAIEPFDRKHPRIKGLSLTSYSLKPHMRWWWGKRQDGQLEMAQFLDYCAELGLDAAEITSYFFEMPVERQYIHRLKRRAHVLGIDISGGAMGNNFSHPPGSDQTRQQLTYYREWLDHFADLGAPVVRVFASRGRPKGATDEQIIQNVIANLQQALPYAEKRGVMLGLENHDFVTNIDYLLRIVSAIDSPWLGVIWDSANLARTPDPYAQLVRIAPYAITAQVKVMTKVNGEHVPADYERLIRILNDASYSGYLVLEYEEPEDPYRAIPKFIRDVRAALASSAVSPKTSAARG